MYRLNTCIQSNLDRTLSDGYAQSLFDILRDFLEPDDYSKMRLAFRDLLLHTVLPVSSSYETLP